MGERLLLGSDGLFKYVAAEQIDELARSSSWRVLHRASFSSPRRAALFR